MQIVNRHIATNKSWIEQVKNIIFISNFSLANDKLFVNASLDRVAATARAGGGASSMT